MRWSTATPRGRGQLYPAISSAGALLGGTAGPASGTGGADGGHARGAHDNLMGARGPKRSRARLARMGSSNRAAHSSTARLLVVALAARRSPSTKASQKSLDSAS